MSKSYAFLSKETKPSFFFLLSTAFKFENFVWHKREESKESESIIEKDRLK